MVCFCNVSAESDDLSKEEMVIVHANAVELGRIASGPSS
jgi:hypothetical protein